MAGIVVLDTGVLIALLNSRDQHHSWAVDVFQRTLDHEWAISALTFAELMVHPYRAGEANTAHDRIAGLNLTIHPVDVDDARQLAALRARTGLKMPDVVVLNLALTTAGAVASTDRALATAARRESIEVFSL